MNDDVPSLPPWQTLSLREQADSGNFSAAIFDLDGVLCDTAEHHFKAWKEIADALGVPFDRKKNERLRGVPRMESLKIILEDVPEMTVDMEALATQKNDRYRELISMLGPEDLLPGAKELLETLKGMHIPIALGSSSKNAKTVISALQIAHLFDAIVDGFGVKHAKPAPDIFLRGAQLLNVDPADCVVVEDAPAGVQAGKAAGMFVVGIARDEPLPDADLHVSGPSDIPCNLWRAKSPSCSFDTP